MATPHEVRSLDVIDLSLLSLLSVDGRMSNRDLAAAAGIAPSTCLTRLRHLRAIGAVRGVHADVDPGWMGCPIQALITVRLRADARSQIDAFATKMRAHRSVLNVFFVSGTYDFLIHAAVADPVALRDIVVGDLNSLPVVASTETHLIFEHMRGSFALPGPTPSARPSRRRRG